VIRLAAEVSRLKKDLETLKLENVRLKETLELWKKGFPLKVDPSSLIKSMQADLIKVDEFATRQSRPTTYVLSDFNIQLKAVVTQEGGKWAWALPSKPAEIDPNLMSTINLNLKPVPLEISPKSPPSAEDVQNIEGIGPETAKKLRDVGILTASDLAFSSVETLGRVNISGKRARELIGMAKLMVKSELSGINGVDEEAAELLVRGAKIDSREKLAEANPEELFTKLREAVRERRVRIPSSYKFAVDDVKRWVDSAKAKTT